jgi:hypothetical protein
MPESFKGDDMNFSRGSVLMDYLRKFKAKDQEGVEQEFTRMYTVAIPLNSAYEEVYGVLAEAISDVKKMEEDEKKRKDAEAKQEALANAVGVSTEDIAELN